MKKLHYILLNFGLIYNLTFSYLKFVTPIDALTIVAPYLPSNPTILEAGAYDGRDTINLCNFFKGKIYSFEPVPYLYGLLFQKVSNFCDSIFTYKLALSDSTGVAKMYVSEEPDNPGIPSQSSSLLAPKEHLTYASTLFKKEIIVPTITIDQWAQENKIEKIDFMWLDLQGYELNVLKASPVILKTVKAILTEVEFVEAYKDQFLFSDVKQWLESQGFTLIADSFIEHGWFGDALFVRKA